MQDYFDLEATSLNGSASPTDRSACNRTAVGRLDGTPWVIWARRVDIKVDNLDAALRPGMAGTDKPRSLTELNIADLR